VKFATIYIGGAMDFVNKKIAILGFGVEGKEAYQYLKNTSAIITICDKLEREQIDLAGVSDDVQFIGGENYLNDLKRFDIIFRSPGIPYLDPKIIEAKKNGSIITSATKLFFDLCPAKIIGVTGTKGKGTTSTLIAAILNKANIKTYLGGNIGEPLLTKLDQITKDDFVVYELSSFQLQDLEKSPDIAVVLNITADHLNVHKDLDEYISSKENIVSNQNKDNFVVINADYLTSFEFASATRANCYYFSRKKWVDQGAYVKDKKQIILNTGDEEIVIANTTELQLRGEHNWENISAASVAAYLAGVEPKIISAIVKEFKGLEHRLELVGEIRGAKYYNDSFATGPDPTIAAIRSFKEPINLILGGRDKNLDFTELGKEIVSNNVKKIILIGELADKLREIVVKNDSQKKIEFFEGAKNMEEIVKMAASNASSGEVVLLSPAAASFDMFQSYKDRGCQFKNQVNKLKN
jgi:UDP-N-acetylmuramoylalanine--D-glutamate ligase